MPSPGESTLTSNTYRLLSRQENKPQWWLAQPMFRFLGGSLYPDVTAQEIAAAYTNCGSTLYDDIGRPFDVLWAIVRRLIPMVSSCDEWQTFADDLPPLFPNPWINPPSPPIRVHALPATRHLLNELIAFVGEMWRADRRLTLEHDGILEIWKLVYPLSFADLLYLSATKNSEFLHQQQLVKKWANPGPEDACQELCERANRLVAEGRRALQSAQGLVSEGQRALQSAQEPVTREVEIGGAAARNEVAVRRRHNGHRE